MPRLARLFSVALLFVASGTGELALAGQGEGQQLLYFSCFDKPYVGVIARNPQRDAFPDIELRLMDPEGRTAGYGSHKSTIPNSHYARVIEIPSVPSLSKAVAVEVCGASQGQYELTVREGADFSYILAARSGGGNITDETQGLNRVAQTGRTCQYKFTFTLQDGHARLKWIDQDGSPYGPGDEVPCIVPRDGENKRA
jgi:hypothetical protein